jgi:type I restriction-modification system DNA methylase subunit
VDKKERTIKIDYKNEFITILKKISYKKTNREIFNDWLIMASAALYSWKKDMKVEEEYKQISKQYSEEQLTKFAQLLGITSLALQKNNDDFLGNIYNILGLIDRKLGQFFSPYNIAHMMAEISTDVNMKENKIYKVYDPACGSGVMLLAIARVTINYKNDNNKNILLVGRDIDSQCVHMTFIQLSLLKVPAIVMCGNSLINEIQWQRETLWYHVYNIEERLIEQEKKENNIKPKMVNSILNHFQRELF